MNHLPMPHSFVAAKITPRLPLCSTHGQRIAASLSQAAKPFLALHVHRNPADDFDYGGANLFVVAREKPGALGVESEYLVVGVDSEELKASENAITVDPPLPFEGPLYLWITPRIYAAVSNKEEFKRLTQSDAEEYRYHLDGASVERFRRALSVAGPSIPVVKRTGGDALEQPGDKWDTWSAETPREVENPIAPTSGRPVLFFFDLIPLDDLGSGCGLGGECVFDELFLLRQLTSDYAWTGCDRVINYVCDMRKILRDKPTFAPGKIFRAPILPSLSSQDRRPPDPQVDDTFCPCTEHLQSLALVDDGDTPNEGHEPNIWDDWADDVRSDVPYFQIPLAPSVPAVMMAEEGVKLVLVDCDVLFNRDGPLKDALVRIFPPEEYTFSPKELLDLYVEFEAIRATDRLPPSPISVVRCIAKYLAISVDDALSQGVLDRYATPRLLPNIHGFVNGLIENGYKCAAIPGPGTSTLPVEEMRSIQGLSLESKTTADGDLDCNPFPLTAETVQALCEKMDLNDIRLNQILLVTFDLYHQCEAAGQLGLPTALLRAEGSRNVDLVLPTVVPTYTLSCLDDLLPVLLGSALDSATTRRVPVFDEFDPPFRFHETYQSKFHMGEGSYGQVCSGIEVHTGASVAIKYELIGHPSKPETLPYEAAVYAQLKGVQGISRIHWYGQETNTNVLVMDKLGPNLEQLRRFCRGRFGLKTVLMLGEQMVSTIEQVHGRGIIVRDIKPENFAPGLVEEYQRLYLFDMGLSKLYLDPVTGAHMPFREGRHGVGTLRYLSHNAHLEIENTRRDDMEGIGNVLLYLLHGQLPWQGIFAPDIAAKMLRIGEMKRGKAFDDFLAQSPSAFSLFFKHCQSLKFEDKPDYEYLRGLFREAMAENGWEYDWEYE